MCGSMPPLSIRILCAPGATLLLFDCCNVLCTLQNTQFRISLAKNFDILRRASRLPKDNSCCRILYEWLRSMRLFCALDSRVRDNCTSSFVYWLRTLFCTSVVPKLLHLAERFGSHRFSLRNACKTDVFYSIVRNIYLKNVIRGKRDIVDHTGRPLYKRWESKGCIAHRRLPTSLLAVY